MSGRLDGKVALITGGARGMGAAEARLFVEHDAKVVLADVLDAEGEVLAKELGSAARYVHLDVTAESSWARGVQEAVSAFGGLDVLVNNAGLAYLAPIVDTTPEEYMRIVSVNQIGVFLGMRAGIPAMTRSRRASIINISSVEGLAGSPGAVAYTASKFAVRGMTKVAALELATLGIRVNSIHPGGVLTPMVEQIGGTPMVKTVEPLIPMHRLAEPEEIARLALFLASDESSYCTGAEFVADGGMTATLFPTGHQ
ncbi:glucose 1-dehydrogenase [Mycobacterium arosiense]|uniref:3-alpha-hydroxysteroid dehydrogenase n=1 Tax=Mycobacterium arosiense ATCC BAA-1401 = DSM 45069 TaxID=1265311 RepID=A0A1W9ZCM6_MYCAI|nr:3-alpha-hydroxysteroid dehydrogenase [Mycobacterium arosiense ATCC BAA-1401 = DSM 45069]